MRALPKIAFSFLVGTLVAAGLSLPAAANRSSHRVVVGSSGKVRFVSRPFISSFFPLTNGVTFPNGVTVRSRFGRFGPFNQFGRFNQFGPFNQFGQFSTAFDGGFGGWDTVAPTDTSPRIVVLNAGPPPALPARSEVSDRPTVETTPSGVQIVRGPGSHHLAR